MFAAASLQGAFDELAAELAEQNPGVTVQPVTYDGSSTLATQLVEGAPPTCSRRPTRRTWPR